MRHRPCIALDEKDASSAFTRQRRKRQSALNTSNPFPASPCRMANKEGLGPASLSYNPDKQRQEPHGHGRVAPCP